MTVRYTFDEVNDPNNQPQILWNRFCTRVCREIYLGTIMLIFNCIRCTQNYMQQNWLIIPTYYHHPYFTIKIESTQYTCTLSQVYLYLYTIKEMLNKYWLTEQRGQKNANDK